MKRTIFAFAILAIVATVESPAQEKKFWVGGSLGMQSSDESQNTFQDQQNSSADYEQNTYSIYPELGYVFSDRWAAGIRFGISHTSTKLSHDQEESRKDKANTFSITPFARYTCLTWKAFGIYVDGGLSYSTGKSDINSYSSTRTTDIKHNSYGIFVTPGFSLRLSDCISLTGNLNIFNAGYNVREAKDTESGSTYSYTNKTKQFFADLNSPFSLDNFTVGFNYRF